MPNLESLDRDYAEIFENLATATDTDSNGNLCMDDTVMSAEYEALRERMRSRGHDDIAFGAMVEIALCELTSVRHQTDQLVPEVFYGED